MAQKQTKHFISFSALARSYFRVFGNEEVQDSTHFSPLSFTNHIIIIYYF